jgi:hypothetical protein
MSGSGGRQTAVSVQPAVGVAGDFCDLNPRYTVDAGAGGLVAGPNGCFVGRFAWIVPPTDSNGAPSQVNNYGTGVPAGFVGREQQGLNVTYLSDASLYIPAGFPVTVWSSAGFWMQNIGASQALQGQKAYANFNDGKVTFAATGSPTSGGVASAGSSWSIAAETSTITATVNGDVLTVTAVSGTYGVAIGALLTGGTGPSSCYVTSQLLPLLSGEALNGVGRYYVSVPEQAATTYTGLSFGLLTLTTVASGKFGVGDTLTVSGTAISAGTTITQLLTGTGGSSSTAIVNLTQTASQGANGTLTAAGNVETAFYARSFGLTNELVKATNQPTP